MPFISSKPISNSEIRTNLPLPEATIKTELHENSVTIKPGRISKPQRELSSHNDHRIVMALTILCSMTGGVIDGAEAVRKSYPNYFDALSSIGLEAEYEA